ncbi:MAG: hypothetical protein IJ242_11085 [Clostridia bacterium]|nr:hypothetical protein [Clostridia bacterium]
MDIIKIERSQAEAVVRFLGKCYEASRFFEICQAPSYRRFISNAMEDDMLGKAYHQMKESLKELGEPKQRSRRKNAAVSAAEEERAQTDHADTTAASSPEEDLQFSDVAEKTQNASDMQASSAQPGIDELVMNAAGIDDLVGGL